MSVSWFFLVVNINDQAEYAYYVLKNATSLPYYGVHLWIFSGHGNSGRITFNDSQDEKDRIFSNMGTYNLTSLNDNKLASIQCMLFMGCNTGLGTGNANLVNAAINAGAHFALGNTKETGITEDNVFLSLFFERAEEEKTIEECLDYALYFSMRPASDIYYLGDIFQILL